MLLVKEVATSTYRYDADGNMLHKFIEEIRQYHYKNEYICFSFPSLLDMWFILAG